MILSLIMTLACISTNDLPIINLNSTNHIRLLGEIDRNSVDKALRDINLLNTNHIFVYIDSHGGSVDEGDRFVSTLRYKQAQGVRVDCIAEKAYSMAFYIFQNCNQRLITPSAKTMQHQISIMSDYKSLTEISGYLNMIQKISENFDVFTSNRLGIALEEYQKKKSKEWWLYGQDIILNNVADRMVLVGFKEPTLIITNSLKH